MLTECAKTVIMLRAGLRKLPSVLTVTGLYTLKVSVRIATLASTTRRRDLQTKTQLPKSKKKIPMIKLSNLNKRNKPLANESISTFRNL